MLTRRFLLAPLVLAGLLLLLFSPRPARAWFATGHMVSASLAYQSLTPAARARVDALLRAHPDFGQWQKTMPAGYADPGRYYFMHASTWPDDIRKTPQDHPTWHYVDYPVVVAAPGFAPDPAKIAPEVPNAQTQIVAETALLSSPAVSDADKAIALCWVAHLIGDIHQPLHTSSLFTPLLPEGDRGGNSINVAGQFYVVDKKKGTLRPENLHAFWDGIFGDTESPLAIDYIVAGLPPLARKDLPELAKSPQLANWISDSNALARKYVYLDSALAQETAPPAPAHPETRMTTATLPAGYLAQAKKVADRQIALAGFRLADTLNAALK